MPPDHEALAAWLQHHEECCPVCAYQLRGLTGLSCPECGASLTLGVIAPEVTHGGWILAMVAYALGLGFDGVVALITLVGLVASRPGFAGPWVLNGSFMMAAAILAALLVRTARRRAHWLRRPRRQQWTRGAVVFIAVGAAHLLYAGALLAWGNSW